MSSNVKITRKAKRKHAPIRKLSFTYMDEEGATGCYTLDEMADQVLQAQFDRCGVDIIDLPRELHDHVWAQLAQLVTKKYMDWSRETLSTTEKEQRSFQERSGMSDDDYADYLLR